MFHVKQFTSYHKNRPIHELLFYFFLFSLPIQTRILYKPDQAYIEWYFNFHLAVFVYLSDLLFITCFIVWVIYDKPKITNNKLLCLILAFFGIILISLFHVKRIDLGLYNAIKWAELLLIVLYVSQSFKTQLQYILVFWIAFISAVFQGLLGLVQFHMQHSFGLGFLGEYIAPLGTSGLATIQVGNEKLIRAYGTMPHPNILGAFMVLGLISGLFLVSHATKRLKIVISMGLFVIALCLFVSFSRLAWVTGAIAVIGFIIYYFSTNRREFVTWILIPILVSCATILIWAPNTLRARVSDTNSASAAVIDRVFFNKLGLDMFRHHPLLGVGVGNYVPALEEANKLDAWQYQPAHNIFIFIAAELGIVGLLLFVLILFEIFSRIKHVPPASPAGGRETLLFTVAGLGILFLAMGQFDHYFVTIQQGRLMFFVVLGMIAALPNIYAQKSD